MRTSSLRSILVLSWLLSAPALLAACDEAPAAPDASIPDDASDPFHAMSPPLTVVGGCDGVGGVEAGLGGDPALDWSRLHAAIRFFGIHDDPFRVDAALVSALGGEDATPGVVDGSDAAFGAYAEAAPETCFVGTWPEPPAPPVAARADVRWLAPGHPIDVAGVDHVLVDLRAAPEGPALRAYLDELAAALLVEPVTPFSALVRQWDGMRDEAWAPLLLGRENLYRSTLVVEDVTFPGGADRELRVGFVVGERIAPSAARFVLAMRWAGRAAILGRPLHVAAAERLTYPAGSGAMVPRLLTLVDTGLATLPDTVAPDVPIEASGLADVEDAFVALGPLGALPAPRGPAERAEVEPLTPRTDVLVDDRGEGTRQAALIAAHGAVTTFFPYWDVVDDDPDERLGGALAYPREDADDPLYLARSIRYLSHAIHDSHGFVFFTEDPPMPPALIRPFPAALDATSSGEPVVRVSTTPELSPGDVIVAIDGEDVAGIIAARDELTSSSDSSRVRNGINNIAAVRDVQTFRVRAPDGAERDVTLDAAAVSETPVVFPARAHGTLEDLGHPELYYVDMSGTATEGNAAEILAGIEAASGVILDVRGYPGPESWTIIGRLLVEGSPGPNMQRVLSTPLGSTREDVPQVTAPMPSGYDGPVMVLVSPSTQSQAEHLILTLQAADRVETVGRPSAGANGNITSIALPGNLGFAFTGMIVLQADGSTFHGVGVAIDHEVTLEPATLAAGIDPELSRAVELLSE